MFPLLGKGRRILQNGCQNERFSFLGKKRICEIRKFLKESKSLGGSK